MQEERGGRGGSAQRAAPRGGVRRAGTAGGRDTDGDRPLQHGRHGPAAGPRGVPPPPAGPSPAARRDGSAGAAPHPSQLPARVQRVQQAAVSCPARAPREPPAGERGGRAVHHPPGRGSGPAVHHRAGPGSRVRGQGGDRHQPGAAGASHSRLPAPGRLFRRALCPGRCTARGHCRSTDGLPAAHAHLGCASNADGRVSRALPAAGGADRRVQRGQGSEGPAGLCAGDPARGGSSPQQGRDGLGGGGGSPRAGRAALCDPRRALHREAAADPAHALCQPGGRGRLRSSGPRDGVQALRTESRPLPHPRARAHGLGRDEPEGHLQRSREPWPGSAALQGLPQEPGAASSPGHRALGREPLGRALRRTGQARARGRPGRRPSPADPRGVSREVVGVRSPLRADACLCRGSREQAQPRLGLSILQGVPGKAAGMSRPGPCPGQRCSSSFPR